MKLPSVTLACVASTHVEESRRVFEHCSNLIDFGGHVLLTEENLKSSDEYSRFILKDLVKYIKTMHVLIVQWDGYILRPELWNDEFLEYDYIGAPWPPNTHFTKEGVEVRVGNGGFSLRSKPLMYRMKEFPFTDNGTGFFHEDGQICNYHRKTLEEMGIKFAPVEVAARFSKELEVPETVESFGFHRYP